MQMTTMLNELSVRPTGFGDSVRSLLIQKHSFRPDSEEILFVAPNDSVFEAVQIMAEAQVGCLLVLRSGHLEGIISERDYARKGILKGRVSRYTLVREIMTAPVLSLSLEDSLERAMSLMTSRRVRHLPVLENGKVAGLVSIGDVVRHLVDMQDRTIQNLTRYISGDYPA